MPEVLSAVVPPLKPLQPQKTSYRIDSIDLLRGLVMIIMALDARHSVVPAHIDAIDVAGTVDQCFFEIILLQVDESGHLVPVLRKQVEGIDEAAAFRFELGLGRGGRSLHRLEGDLLGKYGVAEGQCPLGFKTQQAHAPAAVPLAP